MLVFDGLNAQVNLSNLVPNQIDQDHLGNYYLSFDDELIQFGFDGLEKNRFSNKNNGTITELDASNSMKILLHYQALNSIQFLDNRLGERSDILDLQEAGLAQSHISCSSYNNGVWVYDRVALSLFRLDQNLRENLRTGNLNQIIGREVNPIKMREAGKWLYILDASFGVVICDIYGAYSRNIPAKNVIDMDVDGTDLYILDDMGILRYDAVDFAFKRLLEREQILNFTIQNNKLLFTTEEGLWRLEL